MAQKWANNAFSTLGGAVDSLDTSITISANTGDRFPAVSGDEFFNVTLQNAGGDVEIVKVISRSIGSDQMTIVRGQEATVPLSWAIGDIVELRPTAASFENLSEALENLGERVDDTEEAIDNLSAEAISYDDESVSFEANNVQDAIGTVAQELEALNFSADAISYDDTNSGVVANNVQDAVDETYERADTFVANDERVKTALNASGDQPTYAVRAWVNFDGTDNTIRGSGNVTSVTRPASGDNIINFETPFEDVAYSAVAAQSLVDTSNARILSVRNYTTTSVETAIRNENAQRVGNAPFTSVQVVR